MTRVACPDGHLRPDRTGSLGEDRLGHMIKVEPGRTGGRSS